MSLIEQTYSETPNVNNGLELVFIYALLDKKEKARDVLSKIKPSNDEERIQIEYIRKEKDQLTMEHSFGK